MPDGVTAGTNKRASLKAPASGGWTRSGHGFPTHGPADVRSSRIAPAILSEELAMSAEAAKRRGAYFTPEDAAAALVRWAVRTAGDRMLDPSCGDGRFLRLHPNSVGVERHTESAVEARHRAPRAVVHEADFFRWASETRDRFECAAGNPPFIRYQRFSGDTRGYALDYCRSVGVKLHGPHVVLGPIPGCCRVVAEGRGPHGIRRPGRDRPRTLREAVAPVLARPVRANTIGGRQRQDLP